MWAAAPLSTYMFRCVRHTESGSGDVRDINIKANADSLKMNRPPDLSSFFFFYMMWTLIIGGAFSTPLISTFLFMMAEEVKVILFKWF